MEVTSWNLHHRSYQVELTLWKVPHGTCTMEVLPLEVIPWKLAHATYTMEVTKWNIHHGSYLMERAP